MKFIESIMDKRYNATISNTILNSILIIVIIPCNLYLYEKGFFGEVSFSFIKYKSIVFKSFLPDIIFIAAVLYYATIKFIKKKYTYKTFKKSNLAIEIILLLLFTVTPMILYFRDSFWTSLVFLAGNAGVNMIIVNFIILYSVPEATISNSEQIEKYKLKNIQ